MPGCRSFSLSQSGCGVGTAPTALATPAGAEVHHVKLSINRGRGPGAQETFLAACLATVCIACLVVSLECCHTFPSVSAFSPTPALPPLTSCISWEDACERRDEAAQRMAAAEGEAHKHASGFYLGAWGCWALALFSWLG